MWQEEKSNRLKNMDTLERLCRWVGERFVVSRRRVYNVKRVEEMDPDFIQLGRFPTAVDSSYYSTPIAKPPIKYGKQPQERLNLILHSIYA